MADFPTYPEIRRWKGGFARGLYDKLKELYERDASDSTIKKFQSEEQTGTGSQQSIAHGFGAAPTLVIIGLTDVPDGGAAITEGTHGTANVNVTVTTGAKFKVTAFLITDDSEE